MHWSQWPSQSLTETKNFGAWPPLLIGHFGFGCWYGQLSNRRAYVAAATVVRCFGLLVTASLRFKLRVSPGAGLQHAIALDHITRPAFLVPIAPGAEKRNGFAVEGHAPVDPCERRHHTVATAAATRMNRSRVANRDVKHTPAPTRVARSGRTGVAGCGASSRLVYVQQHAAVRGVSAEVFLRHVPVETAQLLPRHRRQARVQSTQVSHLNVGRVQFLATASSAVAVLCRPRLYPGYPPPTRRNADYCWKPLVRVSAGRLDRTTEKFLKIARFSFSGRFFNYRLFSQAAPSTVFCNFLQVILIQCAL